MCRFTSEDCIAEPNAENFLALCTHEMLLDDVVGVLMDTQARTLRYSIHGQELPQAYNLGSVAAKLIS